MEKCIQCHRDFDPFDEENRGDAVKILIPTWGNDRDWISPLTDQDVVFCSAQCLHKFSDPDTA